MKRVIMIKIKGNLMFTHDHLIRSDVFFKSNHSNKNLLFLFS